MRLRSDNLQKEVDDLGRFRVVVDAEAEAAALLQAARTEAERTLLQAEAAATDLEASAATSLAAATEKAKEIITISKVEAGRITAGAAELARQLEDQVRQKILQAELEAGKITAGAAEQARQLEDQAREEVLQAESDAAEMRKAAAAAAAAIRSRADEATKAASVATAASVRAATEQARLILQKAEMEAQQVAGDALLAKSNAESWTQTATAMRNIVDGYGDRYLIPTYSLLDELADDFGFTEAGEALKTAREVTRSLVRDGKAGECDYVEAHRRDTAVRFVADAFNGRVDSILSRARAENFGTLAQQIRDAYSLVNHHGSAFRNARIRQEYLDARLSELHWAVRAVALRDREREEQRQIKDRLREEERARREFEKAMREAQKEEETLRKAIERAEAQVGKAREEQRAQFEVQLAELNEKLRLAEEKNQRAVSMAQLTRSGHVYVISNIGSFGADVFKIGMTRRLEPTDRVKELGDASVPFKFDVHAMIWSEDAPALEREIQRTFLASQVNKVNPRKEFFRVPIAEIRKVVEGMKLETTWTMAAEALEYRESAKIDEMIKVDPDAREQWMRGQLMWAPDEGFVIDEAEA